MPAISRHADGVLLQGREWRNTVGQSGMTPTAFAFLIPVFVVAIVAPFICAYCIRKRRRANPVSSTRKATKKPALGRNEARERLNEVTEAVNVVAEPEAECIDAVDNTATVTARSVLERECAICLSTLHAPAPAPPDAPTADEATKPPSIKETTPGESDAILRLQVCQHEFHAECLVSWFVLRKTSCPICRAVYYSQEAMQAHDDEESAQLAAAAAAATETQPTPAALEAQGPARTTRSRWFLLHRGNRERNRERNRNVEMQSIQPSTEARSEALVQQRTRTAVPEVVSQPPVSRWQRLRGRP